MDIEKIVILDANLASASDHCIEPTGCVSEEFTVTDEEISLWKKTDVENKSNGR